MSNTEQNSPSPDSESIDQDQRSDSGNSFFDRVRRHGGLASDSAPAPITGTTGIPVVSSEEDEPTEEEGETVADPYQLPHEARRVLVYIMRHGAIIGAQKPKVFEALCRYEALIRRHLAGVYLRLVLDEKAGVAFVALNETETEDDENSIDDEPVALISKRTLSLYDTLLLLVLRRHYQERETAGEQKITVDLERLESCLMPFLPLTNHAKADRKKLNGAVQKLVQKKVLASARGAEDRFEITPIIRYVVDAAFLESMLEEYLRLAQEANIDVDSRLGSVPASDQRRVDQDDLLGGL
tara:strand:- start:246 stop:1136 length:891 start_codon:yes stop_codon:yes gene_type:complete